MNNDKESSREYVCEKCRKTTTSFVRVLIPHETGGEQDKWCGKDLCPFCHREIFSGRKEKAL